jgi:hypothetical protein
VCITNYYCRRLVSGKVSGQKTGYLKYSRWDGYYIEVDETKTYKLSGSYRNGVRIGEWEFSLKTDCNSQHIRRIQKWYSEIR